MPIKLTINGEDQYFDKIIIEDNNITCIPSKSLNISGTLSMNYDEFTNFKDSLLKFVQKSFTDEENSLVENYK